ncbi:hypothetical protein CLOSTASPAR_05135 [[Clostridium] asparagiforme DSM 15981]|uniref:Uncharacterized protein n=1 Tax=[Clostridium] asparagiforme DSM 15981 TaxID=518636 RepID=C0D787_9FIRM|nr:hypothetical protein CLOSTASPAR_05135 [[Clostridium] asparagiforme DSM 15981]
MWRSNAGAPSFYKTAASRDCSDTRQAEDKYYVSLLYHFKKHLSPASAWISSIPPSFFVTFTYESPPILDKIIYYRSTFHFPCGKSGGGVWL